MSALSHKSSLSVILRCSAQILSRRLVGSLNAVKMTSCTQQVRPDSLHAYAGEFAANANTALHHTALLR